MNKKIVTMIVLLMVLSIVVSASSAAITVGVKKGDWIEYNVTYTGTPPEGHDVNWARMEVLDVHGAEITLNITTTSANGTTSSQTFTLNLEQGELGDDFIIPANLKDGDVFFDARDGNITIGSAESRTYAGATRVVVTGTMRQALDYWDQSTGVLLEGTSTLENYTMTAKVDQTNLWQSQAGLDQTILIVLALVVIVIVAVAIIFVAMRRKK